MCVCVSMSAAECGVGGAGGQARILVLSLNPSNPTQRRKSEAAIWGLVLCSVSPGFVPSKLKCLHLLPPQPCSHLHHQLQHYHDHKHIIGSNLVTCSNFKEIRSYPSARPTHHAQSPPCTWVFQTYFRLSRRTCCSLGISFSFSLTSSSCLLPVVECPLCSRNFFALS